MRFHVYSFLKLLNNLFFNNVLDGHYDLSIESFRLWRACGYQPFYVKV